MYFIVTELNVIGVPLSHVTYHLDHKNEKIPWKINLEIRAMGSVLETKIERWN